MDKEVKRRIREIEEKSENGEMNGKTGLSCYAYEICGM